MRKILLGNPASRENFDADLQPRAGTPQKRTEFDGFPPCTYAGGPFLPEISFLLRGPFPTLEKNIAENVDF
jgi:hypothetical protein